MEHKSLLYQGVWFQLEGTPQSTWAIHFAPEWFGLVHQPLSNMNLTELWAQTAIHGASQVLQPAITGFATAPTNPIDWPSRPSSWASSNAQIFGTGLNFRQGWSISTPRASRWPVTPEGGDDPDGSNNGALDPDEQKFHKILRMIKGDWLKGSPPELFKGDWADMMRFLLAFDHYTFLNHNAGIMKDPHKRAALFLGLIQGKAVSWANRASKWLKDVCDRREVPPFGFDVWQVTERKFKDVFTDYADADRAHQELLKLCMKDGRLDEYVATFQDLVTRAGLDQNSPNTLQTFAQGLQGTLATTCIMQDSPENFPQWVQSAQQQHRNWLKCQALKEYSPFQNQHRGTNPFTWKWTITTRRNTIRTPWTLTPFEKQWLMLNVKNTEAKVDASIAEGKATLVAFVLTRNLELQPRQWQLHPLFQLQLPRLPHRRPLQLPIVNQKTSAPASKKWQNSQWR